MASIRLSRASIALIFICLLDMLSTLFFVAHGKAVESNPIMDMFLQISPMMFVLAKLLSFIPFIVAVEWYKRYNPRFCSMVTRCAIVTYLVVYIIATAGVNRI